MFWRKRLERLIDLLESRYRWNTCDSMNGDIHIDADQWKAIKENILGAIL